MAKISMRSFLERSNRTYPLVRKSKKKTSKQKKQTINHERKISMFFMPYSKYLKPFKQINFSLEKTSLISCFPTEK